MLTNHETNGLKIYKLDNTNTALQSIPLYSLDVTNENSIFSDSVLPLDFVNVPNAPKCDGAIYVRGDNMFLVLHPGYIVGYKII